MKNIETQNQQRLIPQAPKFLVLMGVEGEERNKMCSISTEEVLGSRR